MEKRFTTLAAALVFGVATLAAPAARPETGRDCFPAGTAWQGWNAAADGDVLYLRVHVDDIYRVDLSPGSGVRKWPGHFLVNQVRGSSWICSALDLDLTLAAPGGFRVPLIAVSLRKLTPEEAAAIPDESLP
jgi:hypothetical protein